ncbi:MAG TPA: hypothetical protein VFU89_07875 [Rhabdochlamydiaceae bacterium]|nr:hypothetical protein [Rhabdochlamydiaceae bacterium]
MNIDITQLLIIFDELMPATDEEKGVYWFKTLRSDGLIIAFAFSIHEEYVDIIIHNASKVDIASLSLENCTTIKVLDEKRKCLEIQHKNGRCFLSLLGSPILDYED